MNYTRLYSDDQGETHFEDLSFDFTLTEFAPPADPVPVSAYTAVDKLVFVKLPPGTNAGWHPTPRVQMVIILSGETESQVSTGEKRRFKPGDVALVEDTTGKGHKTTVVGDAEVLMAMVQL